MKILAIETSCDETAAAVIGDNAHIISNVVVSQVDIFAAYGGVIPEVAARSHLEAILPVIHQALTDAHCTPSDIDYIAVTYAPGLLGSLLIGTLTARTLAILWQKPLYAVHHLKSHIYANWLTESSKTLDPTLLFSRSSGGSAEVKRVAPATAGGDDAGREKTVKLDRVSTLSDSIVCSADHPAFPLLSLVISGGHTQIIYMPEHNHFEIIGTTRDDAVGECFDKVAKILGLPYPGGPSIATSALTGDPNRYRLPHPNIDGLDFSFSGLKTAVLRSVQAACDLPITTPSYELASHLTDQQKSDFAASFQSTACDILLEKLQLSLDQHSDVRSLVFAGGVSANRVLRDYALSGRHGFNPHHLPVYFPTPQYTGDNAAMVGAAAFYEIVSGVSPTDPYHLDILPRTPIK